jgi:hypothetical protein
LRSFRKFKNGNGLRVVQDIVVFSDASRLRVNLCSFFHKFASFLFHTGFQFFRGSAKAAVNRKRAMSIAP